MKSDDLPLHLDPAAAPDDDEGPTVSLTDLLIWIGESKGLIAGVTLLVAAVAVGVALLLPPVYTARATMMAPNNQQQSASSNALAALGALGGLGGGLAQKTPDELYVALLKSDSVVRALDKRFKLQAHYDVKDFETLRKVISKWVHIAADKKSGVISVEVDDESPTFAAELANAHAGEVGDVLSRLAISEAQLRRVFFEGQLKETKENLVKAEQAMQATQEKSGMIVLDKQAEALLLGAAQIRAQIADREIQLKVLRTGATEQNPAVMRLTSELAALRAELARMESAQGGVPGSSVDMPVGKLPGAAVDFIRARRELKIQETLLESMLRQYEIAKLDEAKEGPALQQIDFALPPDRKSKPSRALVVLVSALVALLLTSAIVVMRRYIAYARSEDPHSDEAWNALSRAWRWRH